MCCVATSSFNPSSTGSCWGAEGSAHTTLPIFLILAQNVQTRNVLCWAPHLSHINTMCSPICASHHLLLVENQALWTSVQTTSSWKGLRPGAGPSSTTAAISLMTPALPKSPTWTTAGFNFESLPNLSWSIPPQKMCSAAPGTENICQDHAFFSPGDEMLLKAREIWKFFSLTFQLCFLLKERKFTEQEAYMQKLCRGQLRRPR